MFCSAYIQCFAVIKDSVPADIRATSLAASNMIHHDRRADLTVNNRVIIAESFFWIKR